VTYLSSYMIQPVSAMRQHPEMIPEEPGLYALILDHPAALEPALERARLRLEHVRLGQRCVLYIGSTDDSLRRRVKCHLSNDTGRSTFRMSLGALLADELGLVARPVPGASYFCFEPGSEAVLSAWIGAHVSVAVKPAREARAKEPGLIRAQQPPLNIAGRGASFETGVMLMLRRRCQGLAFDPGSLN
jgi:hypothetical protein